MEGQGIWGNCEKQDCEKPGLPPGGLHVLGQRKGCPRRALPLPHAPCRAQPQGLAPLHRRASWRCGFCSPASCILHSHWKWPPPGTALPTPSAPPWPRPPMPSPWLRPAVGPQHSASWPLGSPDRPQVPPAGCSSPPGGRDTCPPGCPPPQWPPVLSFLPDHSTTHCRAAPGPVFDLCLLSD